jgi:hypothetical protein
MDKILVIVAFAVVLALYVYVIADYIIRRRKLWRFLGAVSVWRDDMYYCWFDGKRIHKATAHTIDTWHLMQIWKMQADSIEAVIDSLPDPIE